MFLDFTEMLKRYMIEYRIWKDGEEDGGAHEERELHCQQVGPYRLKTKPRTETTQHGFDILRVTDRIGCERYVEPNRARGSGKCRCQISLELRVHIGRVSK